jgi:hypothetical protein
VPESPPRFRLRPRRVLATYAILAFGCTLIVLPLAYGVGGAARALDMLGGLGVVLTTAIYLASPTWRSYVVCDEGELRVVGPRGDRFRVAFSELQEVIIDEEEHAALLRGPDGKRSFLVPSSAHPAPYRIEHSAELFARVLERTPKERIRRSKVFR